MGDFLRAGILVYVGIWACLRFMEWKEGKSQDCNVFHLQRLEIRGRLAKWTGWIIALIVVVAGSVIFPKVYVVAQDTDAGYPGNVYMPVSVRESFIVKRIFVPFRYKGHSCSPGDIYISNETDSTLVLYLTELFNGMYTYVSSADGFTDVPAHCFMRLNDGISNEFKKPYGTWYGYVPEGKRNKKTREWTLDLREYAERDCEYISSQINESKSSYPLGSANDIILKNLGIPVSRIEENASIIEPIEEQRYIPVGDIDMSELRAYLDSVNARNTEIRKTVTDSEVNARIIPDSLWPVPVVVPPAVTDSMVIARTTPDSARPAPVVIPPAVTDSARHAEQTDPSTLTTDD